MTEDMTPGDLTGTVREVQQQLRERYGASSVEIDARDAPYPEDEVETRFILEWLGDDLPSEPDRSPIASHIHLLMQKVKAIQQDFPEADVSTHTDRTQAKLDLRFEDEGEPA